MKKTIFCLLMVLTAKIAAAQYKPLDQDSELKFTIGNFGFDVTGTFTGLMGIINFDPQSLLASSFDVNVDANTINTNNTLRDKHLKEDGYFDVKNYPQIRLVSGKIAPGNKAGTFILTGQLIIKGVSKNVSFPFSSTPTDDGYVFKGSFKINRKDFGVGGTSTISNELEVSLNVTAKKDQPKLSEK